MATEEGGHAADFTLDLAAALDFLGKNPDLIPELELNINSPGFLRMLSEGYAPLVVAACLALALAGCDDIKADQLRVINSAAPTAHHCEVQVAKSVQDIFTLIDYPTWKTACASARSAHVDTGLKTVVTAVKK